MLNLFCEEMKLRKNEFQDIQPITSAYVPILKFKHRKSSLNSDLSFKNGHSVANSKLVKWVFSVLLAGCAKNALRPTLLKVDGGRLARSLFVVRGKQPSWLPTIKGNSIFYCINQTVKRRLVNFLSLFWFFSISLHYFIQIVHFYELFNKNFAFEIEKTRSVADSLYLINALASCSLRSCIGMSFDERERERKEPEWKSCKIDVIKLKNLLFLELIYNWIEE